MIGLIQNVGVYWAIVMLIFLFVNDFYDFKKLLLSLMIILFVSNILIGFYQYFTNSILSPWIEEADILVYTSSYDLQRLRSFLDQHPANSANGILFVTCITIVLSFSQRKPIYIIIFGLSLIAIFLTYTRMAYLTVIALLLIFTLGFSKLKSLSLSKLFISFFSIIIIITKPNNNI